MSASGTYYLDNDITIATSHLEFTGVFDGNGHTVTISTALFAKLSGTVKNLTVLGILDNSAKDDNTGTVADDCLSGEVMNVCNKANVTGYNGAYYMSV